MKKAFTQILGFASGTLALGLAAILAPAPAQAAVNLSLNSSGASSVTVHPGSTISVTLNITSTAESLTGVDYYFTINGAASGKVRLASRDISASPFADANLANTGDNNASPGVLDANFSLLNPKNSLDLGATLTNVATALSPSTYALGTYTFTLDPTIASGTYTLATTSFAGSGVVTQAPNFFEKSFDAQGSLSVVVTPAVGTVVPEPTGAMALLGLGGLALRRRKR